MRRLLLAFIHLCTAAVETMIATECGLNACTSSYESTMEYEALIEAPEERYCQVLNDYIGCLNRTHLPCRGTFSYAATNTGTRVRYRNYACDAVFERARRDREERKHWMEQNNRCRMKPSTSSDSTRHCALWGDPHLRTFDGRLHACAEAGARPMIDNRFFLVQVSSARVRDTSVITAVSKVTVIIREHNCTGPKRYEASSDSADLPDSFVDGTVKSAHVGDVRAVEVIRQSPHHISIVLRHAGTTIEVRRRGPYLSVGLTMPNDVFAQAYHPSSSDALPFAEQLCHAGCPLKTIVPLSAALADPQGFSDCHGAPIMLPLKLATERCKSFNTSDDFYDACVFDLMLTGDETLATMSRDAQTDLEHELNGGNPYSVGRVDLTPYDHLVTHKWQHCIPSSSFYLPLRLSLIFMVLGRVLF